MILPSALLGYLERPMRQYIYQLLEKQKKLLYGKTVMGLILSSPSSYVQVLISLSIVMGQC